jgi:hypothetical protein
MNKIRIENQNRRLKLAVTRFLSMRREKSQPPINASKAVGLNLL